MALERRGNRWYFYRKERRGNRVVSIYSGPESLAQCLQFFDRQRQEEARLEEESKKLVFETERQRQAEGDQVIDTYCEEAKAVEDALFLINGYHIHSRQWRSTRYDKKN